MELYLFVCLFVEMVYYTEIQLDVPKNVFILLCVKGCCLMAGYIILCKNIFFSVNLYYSILFVFYIIIFYIICVFLLRG